MNFYEFRNRVVGKFWVAAESSKEAEELIKSGNFTIFNLNDILSTPKENGENNTERDAIALWIVKDVLSRNCMLAPVVVSDLIDQMKTLAQQQPEFSSNKICDYCIFDKTDSCQLDNSYCCFKGRKFPGATI